MYLRCLARDRDVRGCSGFHGRSSSLTIPTNLLFEPSRSRSSMAARPRL
jgi:hypothetical protein